MKQYGVRAPLVKEFGNRPVVEDFNPNHDDHGEFSSGSGGGSSASGGTTKRGITQVNGHLREVVPGIKVVRGRGYYYLADTGEANIAAALYSSSIPWNFIDSTPKAVADAIDHIAHLFEDYHNSTPRQDIATKLHTRAARIRGGR